jgi:ATP-dependent helicase/nuclease subunit A
MNNDLTNIDEKSRLDALNLKSFIVEAPAGAGKTELLTQRFLKLLACVESPEEIVALTFTNKAATEMRNRILQSLEAAIVNAPTDAPHKQITRNLALNALQHAENMGWDLLNQPARLRILTMDALCASLARQMPFLSRFGGQPKVTDDAASHYLSAAQQTLAHIHHEQNLGETVSTAVNFMHNHIEKLTELLADMLGKRDQWLGLANEHANETEAEIASQVSAALNVLIAERLQLAYECFPAKYQQLLMPVARFAASNLDDETHAFKPLLDWQTPLSSDVADLSMWQALSGFLVKDDGEFRKKTGLNATFGFPKHEFRDAHKDTFEGVCELIGETQALQALRKLPNVSSDELNANSVIVKALAQLLKLATGELWASFQAANEVDFVQIAQSASYALQNEDGSTDLALKLDYKISHLLIDEFQDTSPTQMRLIEQLTLGWQPNDGPSLHPNGDGRTLHPNGDGRTLFCVGDPMQSIYRFRKADVSLFLRTIEAGIGQVKLHSLTLNRNNRSHPAVIDWINHTFETVFPLHDDMAQAAVRYRKFAASKPTIADEGVQIHALVAANDDESDEAKLAEARYVADLISKEQETTPQQTIAVLVRSRSHLRELVSTIRRAYPHLHFQALEIEGLNDRQTVLDAYSLTRALLHRADRIHWLNILRAPWCGLTLADLHALANDDAAATIWQLMADENRLKTLTIDGQKRLNHIKNVLQMAFAEQARMPLRRWLESTWLKLGGGNTLVAAGDNRDVQRFFDLVEKLARGLVLDFAQLDTAMQKLFAEPDLQASGKLQFLTIHKAKGLEFDCVILPALNRPPRPKDAPLMLWEEVQIANKMQLLAAPFAKNNSNKPNIYDFLNALENDRANNETARLLYVAATRAVRKLHLVGTVKLTANNGLTPKNKTFLALLWPKLAADFEAASANKMAMATADETQPDTQLKSPQTDLPTLAKFSAKLMRLSQPKVPNFLAINSDENETSTYPNMAGINQNKASPIIIKNNNIAQDAGSLAHLYMELIARSGLAQWPASRIADCAPNMAMWLRQKNHLEIDAEKYVLHIQNALRATIDAPEAAWILAPRASSQSELSLSANIEEKNVDKNVTENRIDLTFIDDENTTAESPKTRWIIDYKMTFFEAEKDLKKLAGTHRPQLERYEKLFLQEKIIIKKAVFFLAFGKLVLL